MTDNSAINRKSSFGKWFKRTANGTITFLGVPANTILIIFGVLLLLLNIAPIFSLISESLTDTEGLFTWNNYSRTFNWSTTISQGYFWKPLGRSLLVSTLSCIFAIIFGGVTAFLLARTNIKFKKFISAVFIFPYIMPQWTLALFWKNMFQFQSQVVEAGGVVTTTGIIGEFQALFGVHMPTWFVEGAFPISLVLGLHYAPFAYILIGGVLQNMDSNLEEAASILGIPKWKSFFKVTIPMLKPAILSTILLVFSSAMSSYSVAATLGGTSYRVLATSMQSMLKGSGRNYGMGYVMALVLILIGLFILILNQIQTGSRKQFTTVTGKSGQISKQNLGKAGKWIVGGVLVVIVLFFCIGPMVSFFLESLLPNSGDWSSGLTWRAWFSQDVIANDFHGFFFEPKVANSLLGTLKLSIFCALGAGIAGFLIGYAVSKKRKSKGAKFVNGIAFFPYLMPSIALSQCFFLLGTNMKLSVSTTTAAAVFVASLVGIIKYIPMASRSSLNAMMQLSGEIEEAGIIQGIPWWKRMTRVIFPIQKAAIISGFLLPFISCMREYDLFLFLGDEQLSLTKFMFQLDSDGVPALMNAANLVLIFIILIANWLVNLLTGASIDKGLGGSK